ncbi:MAG: tyrosine--tRNA ligase [Patescibacteria group bacterium]
MKINTDATKVNELLTRGVENVYPTREFLEKRLKSGEQLSLYCGYDPTAPSLHIGHAITMMKLRQFQDLGHRVIMLIGDFTGLIGDPTDKTATRKQQTREEVEKNFAGWKKQAASILDFDGDNPVEIKYNSEWHKKLSFEDVLNLSSHFTVQRMLERDMFEKRVAFHFLCPMGHEQDIKEIVDVKTWLHKGNFGSTIKFRQDIDWVLCNACKKKYDLNDLQYIPPKPIYVHEFMYPLLQGYDSVAMDVDGEIGGNDQTFNMLAGRDLMKDLKNKEKFVLTTKLLADTGGKKMSKSEGNAIFLTDTPEEIFGKVMSWTDGMIAIGFELCTWLPMDEIKKIIKENDNPRDQKVRLAYEVVKTFTNEKSADSAKENFINQFSKKEIPEDMPEVKADNVIDALIGAKICKSKSEARQVIDQGGVKINEKKVEAGDYTAEVKSGDIVQKGSRWFARIK